MPLDLSISDIPGLVNSSYLKIGGTFDEASASRFARYWQTQVNSQAKRFFILDLAAVAECAEPGATCLHEFSDAVTKQRGGVVIVNPSRAVVQAMKSAGVGHAMTFFLDYSKAYEHLRRIDKHNREETKKRSASEDSDTARISLYANPPTTHPARLPGDTGMYAAPGHSTAPNIDHPAPNANSAPGSDSAGTGGFRFRAFTSTGVTLQQSSGNDTGRIGAAGDTDGANGRHVVIATPPTPDFIRLRNLLAHAADKAGMSAQNLFPLRPNQGWPFVLKTVATAQIALVVFTPKSPSPDPNADVLMAATVARTALGDNRVLILSSRPKLPELWAKMPREIYSDEPKRIDDLIDRLIDRLKNLALDPAN